MAHEQDADRPVRVGERVVAVQDGDADEPDFVGDPVVTQLSGASGLIYLSVDWSSFRDDGEILPTGRGIRHQRGA